MVTQAISKLLNQKHLYQHVDVPVDEFLGSVAPMDTGLASHIISHEWATESEVDYSGQAASVPHWPRPRFAMPSLRTYCPQCEEVFPFNPGEPTAKFTFSDTYQVFALSFQCQGCKGTPIVFVVTRKGKRLTLSGRSEFELVRVPKDVPKEQRRYYSDALVAFNCGQILPALFMLRTLIEQHMRSVVSGDFETGEDLCAAYNATLNEHFKAWYPSFTDIYATLSDALHAAKADDGLFETEIKRIESHFEGKGSFDRAAGLKPEESAQRQPHGARPEKK